MSPGRHHFSEMKNNPIDTSSLEPGMNLWFGFFSVTGIDKAITKMFVFTPKVDGINTNPAKDSQSGTKNNPSL
jgi:hypothetical protein